MCPHASIPKIMRMISWQKTKKRQPTEKKQNCRAFSSQHRDDRNFLEINKNLELNIQEF